MDETTANKLFDTAVYLAYKSTDNPDDATILSLFGMLIYTCESEYAPLH